MKRDLMHSLHAWKENPRRKPLLLYGARQVGKTWLLEDFGKTAYTQYVKVDFMKESWAHEVFAPDLDVQRIISEIEMRKHMRIAPGQTLLILDEVQESPRALTSLKYFCEDAREYHVAAAGSYMGIARHEGSSFPVGKVDTLTLRPLSFSEFLRAQGADMLADAIGRHKFESITRSSKDIVEDLLKRYYVVGGMPEVVDAYSKGADLDEVRAMQADILSDYDGDFSKHAPARILERMRLVWRSVPSQLARENKKFVFGAVRPGARAADLEESIQWLQDYGVIHKVSRVNALRIPLSGYDDLSAFKLYALDIGLLGAMASLDPAAVIEGSRLFIEFKGALTEQFVCQELLSSGLDPHYWSAERATAEVDFAIDGRVSALPIEVKAAENLRSKSLRAACDRFGLGRAVRVSLSGYRDEGWLVNVPLWAACEIVACAEGFKDA